MSVVRALNTIHFFIFAVLLPVSPQLPKKKKKRKKIPIPPPPQKKAPNQQPKKSPKSPAVCDAIYPNSKFC